MTPADIERVLDIFFTKMDDRHWSTATADIDAAHDATIRILSSSPEIQKNREAPPQRDDTHE